MAAGRKKSRQSAKSRKQQVENRKRIILTIIILALVVGGIMLARKYTRDRDEVSADSSTVEDESTPGRPDLDVQLLSINEYSRPGIAMDQVNGIVMHYTANPGSSAINNRDYFENLKTSHTTKASSHFVVGLDGEIVQCIPTAEIAYASNDRNGDTIAIECCHPDESGQFNESTYNSMVELTAWLCKKFGLDSEAVIRHYDITGKDCPKYFVENPDAWEQYKADVQNRIEEL